MRHRLIMVLLAAPLQAPALEVIHDAGGESIGSYLARLAPRDRNTAAVRLPEAKVDRTYSLARILPIRSPSLTPGPVEARQVHTRLLQPLFLIGADPQSAAWLETNRPRLQQLNAIGMLVQAETEADLQAVAKTTQGLPLIPASGEALAQTLGLAHYPVLITREGITQ